METLSKNLHHLSLNPEDNCPICRNQQLANDFRNKKYCQDCDREVCLDCVAAAYYEYGWGICQECWSCSCECCFENIEEQIRTRRLEEMQETGESNFYPLIFDADPRNWRYRSCRPCEEDLVGHTQLP